MQVLALLLLATVVLASHPHIYNSDLAQLETDPTLVNRVTDTWVKTSEISRSVSRLNERILTFNLTEINSVTGMVSTLAKLLKKASNAHTNVLPQQAHITIELLRDTLDIIELYQERTNTTLFSNQTGPAFKQDHRAPGFWIIPPTAKTGV